MGSPFVTILPNPLTLLTPQPKLQPTRLPSSSQPKRLCSLQGKPTFPQELTGSQALSALSGRERAARVTVATVLTLGGTVSEQRH